MTLPSNSRLAVAMDFSSWEEVQTWAQCFEDLPLMLKIGLRLLPEMTRTRFDNLKEQGFELFIDTKLHDIPSQVAGAVSRWADWGADRLTIHLSGGSAMCRAAAEAAQGSKLKILGVSVLTSLNESDLQEIGIQVSASEQVKRLVNLGLQAGLNGFVCSAAEASLVKQLTQNKPVEIVCPGVSMPGEAAAADQKRVVTIPEAIQKGADMLVVGRAIFGASDPRARAKEILEMIQ